jgi:sugar-specific transcriptional regulator TrmB
MGGVMRSFIRKEFQSGHMITESLEEIGLTKSEISVYMAMLELGSTTTGPIVEKAGVASSKIYEILEKLIQKGLASVIVEAGIKHFEAAPPERILDYLNEKKAKLVSQEQEIKNIIPELRLKQTLAKYKTEATLFRGAKGMETAFNDIFKTLKSGGFVYAFVVGELDERMNNFFIKHYKERAKNGIKTKTIYSEMGRKFYDARKDIKGFEGKVIPEAISSPATMNIYGSKVIIRIGDSKNVVCVMINNQELVDSFLQQFNMLWNQDIHVYKGFENVTEKFAGVLDSMKVGDEYCVLGASYGMGGQKLKDWFYPYHKLRFSRKIKVRLLCAPSDYDVIYDTLLKSGDYNMETAQLRKLPNELTSPMQINLYPSNKVIIYLWGKEIVCFEVDSEVLYNNFKNYFELLWRQSS